MKFDFLGRLEKGRVLKSQPLLPVFEAMMNCIPGARRLTRFAIWLSSLTFHL